jgi:UDP-2,3-diacylglucosamine pyrophosphatase LpxH
MVPTQVKIVFSDVHMGAGQRPGLVNHYEDFHHDDRLAELIIHYAAGHYADLPVEIVINGDFLDLLKLPVDGRFGTDTTEEVAVEKVRRCILGHPMVFDALAAFLRRPRHRVTYVPGNHDTDVAFPRVQRMISARLDVPEGSESLAFIDDRDLYRLPGGVVVAHGHNFEEVNRVGAGNLLVKRDDGRQIVNVPYGGQFFAEVLAPVKAEQPLIDLVHPLSSFILWGLLFDLRFTLRVIGRTIRFILTRKLTREQVRGAGLLRTLQLMFVEVAMTNNMERRACRLLRTTDDIRALIVGHSHFAKVRRFPRGKVFVNTGTWVKIVSLDLRDLGTRNVLTYALVEYAETGAPAVRLMRWRGTPREKEELVN